MIYLDNASTTKIDPEVLEEMMPYLTDEYGNAGTLYDLGFSARKAIDKARERVAKLMGASDPEQIIFTSGGTESNNTVFHSYALTEMENGTKRGVITSRIEHDSVLRPVEFLKTKLGVDVTLLYPDKRGEITQESLVESLSNNVGLASFMYVNNEVGSINNIRKLASVCNDNGILLHCDCVQAAGCNDILVEEWGCDFASISSHKIHGPKGVGALYVKDKDRLSPMIMGGAAQEFGFRGGTENVAGIVGLGKACDIYSKACDRYYETPAVHYRVLQNTCKRVFWNTLCDALRKMGLYEIVHDNALSSILHGKTLSVRFDGVDAEALVLLMGTKGVYISAGSACTSHKQNPSHVLKGIGLTDDEARSTVRVSFSRMNTNADAEKAAIIMAESVFNLVERG